MLFGQIIYVICLTIALNGAWSLVEEFSCQSSQNSEEKSCEQRVKLGSLKRNQHSRSDDRASSSASQSNAKDSTTEMAVMLYDESIISPFHKTERLFRFGRGKDEFQVRIQQDWKDGGVAAVVWESVSVLT